MRYVKLAAGLAAGYVLGARAGREKYDRMVAAVRKAGGGPGEASVEGHPQGLQEPSADVVVPPAVVPSTERPTPSAAGDKPRRSRNRRTKTAAPSSTDESPAMSTGNLSLDGIPMEAAEADVIEQNTPVVDRSDVPASDSVLESDAADAQEQRRSL
jgi:hypothetical protein